jgi:hypothetical protein
MGSALISNIEAGDDETNDRLLFVPSIYDFSEKTKRLNTKNLLEFLCALWVFGGESPSLQRGYLLSRSRRSSWIRRLLDLNEYSLLIISSAGNYSG